MSMLLSTEESRLAVQCTIAAGNTGSPAAYVAEALGYPEPTELAARVAGTSQSAKCGAAVAAILEIPVTTVVQEGS